MTILQKQYIQYNLKFNKVKNAKIRSTGEPENIVKSKGIET